MIKLDVQDYCHRCPHFEAKVTGGAKLVLQHRWRSCRNHYGGHSHKVHTGKKMCLGCGRGAQAKGGKER